MSIESNPMQGNRSSVRAYQRPYPLLYATAQPMTPYGAPQPIADAMSEYHEHRRAKHTFIAFIVLDIVLAIFFCSFNTAFAFASESYLPQTEANYLRAIEDTEPVEPRILAENLTEFYEPGFGLMSHQVEELYNELEEAIIKDQDHEFVTIEENLTPLTSPEMLQEQDPMIETKPEPVSVEAPIETAQQSNVYIEPAIRQVPRMTPNTMIVNGTLVPYIHCVKAPTCPDNGAGLWEGDDDIADGSFAYFVGHNPGDYTCVYALRAGDIVSVCDRKGQVRDYTVTGIYEVPDTSSFEEVQRRLIPAGECIVMQTCISINGTSYRIVVAQ